MTGIDGKGRMESDAEIIVEKRLMKSIICWPVGL
jgi:hypothetical protein